MMNKEEKIGMYTSDEIYEELANGFLQRSMVDAMYFKIKDLQQRIDKAIEYIEKHKLEYKNNGEVIATEFDSLTSPYYLLTILGGKE